MGRFSPSENRCAYRMGNAFDLKIRAGDERGQKSRLRGADVPENVFWSTRLSALNILTLDDFAVSYGTFIWRKNITTDLIKEETMALTIDSSIKDLMKNPEAVEICKKHGMDLTDRRIKMAGGMSARKLAGIPGTGMSADQTKALEEELAAADL